MAKSSNLDGYNLLILGCFALGVYKLVEAMTAKKPAAASSVVTLPPFPANELVNPLDLDT